MRISDWSSDVCSSDLEREWDKRRVAGPGGDRDRGKRRLRRADHGGHALTIPVRQMTGRSKSPPPPPGRTGERLMATDSEALPGCEPKARSETLVIAASSLGTVFEWYDFYLYGLLASAISVHFRSEEHTSELQSLMRNSYADFCLK